MRQSCSLFSLVRGLPTFGTSLVHFTLFPIKFPFNANSIELPGREKKEWPDAGAEVDGEGSTFCVASSGILCVS